MLEFQTELEKLLEKHNADIPRATTKYKHTNTVLMEAFNKEFVKPMDASEFQDPEKFLTIWVKILIKLLTK